MRRNAERTLATVRFGDHHPPHGEYLDNHNADPKPFVWTKSAGQILEKVARAKQALESQH